MVFLQPLHRLVQHFKIKNQLFYGFISLLLDWSSETANSDRWLGDLQVKFAITKYLQGRMPALSSSWYALIKRSKQCQHDPLFCMCDTQTLSFNSQICHCLFGTSLKQTTVPSVLCGPDACLNPLYMHIA